MASPLCVSQLEFRIPSCPLTWNLTEGPGRPFSLRMDPVDSMLVDRSVIGTHSAAHTGLSFLERTCFLALKGNSEAHHLFMAGVPQKKATHPPPGPTPRPRGLRLRRHLLREPMKLDQRRPRQGAPVNREAESANRSARARVWIWWVVTRVSHPSPSRSGGLRALCPFKVTGHDLFKRAWDV